MTDHASVRATSMQLTLCLCLWHVRMIEPLAVQSGHCGLSYHFTLEIRTPYKLYTFSIYVPKSVYI